MESVTYLTPEKLISPTITYEIPGTEPVQVNSIYFIGEITGHAPWYLKITAHVTKMVGTELVFDEHHNWQFMKLLKLKTFEQAQEKSGNLVLRNYYMQRASSLNVQYKYIEDMLLELRGIKVRVETIEEEKFNDDRRYSD